MLQSSFHLSQTTHTHTCTHTHTHTHREREREREDLKELQLVCHALLRLQVLSHMSRVACLVVQAWLDTLGGTQPQVKPGNVWTQDHVARNPSGRATPSPGVWGKQGQLAGELRAVKSAWTKK
jgi:hypothetical protein